MDEAAPTRPRVCTTSTWATRCTSCSAPAYFVTCTCDGRVLMDDLGPTWLVHDCGETWRRHRIRGATIAGDVGLDGRDAVPPRRSGFPHPIELETLRVWRPSQHLETVHVIAPVGGYRATVDGRVHALLRSVDPYRHLGMVRGDLSRNSLQELAAGPVGLLTLNRPSRYGADHIDEYELFVPSRLLMDVAKGITVSAAVEGRVIVGSRSWWYARDLELH